MKIRLLIILSFLSNIFSCQDIKTTDKKSKEQVVMDGKQIINNNIKSTLEKQLKDGYKEEIVELEEIKALFEVESVLLKNNGYKELTFEQFKDKIKLIFNKDINESNDFISFEVNQPCYVFNQNTWKNLDLKYLFLSLKHKFISDLLWLPEILDYQKEYPELCKKEVHIEGADYRLWKDIDDLPKQRRYNQQLLISRNKYLFNDDPSQFSWLITNDEDFMQSLVTTFGYTEDKKLLKWAFEKQGFSDYQKYPPDEILENYGKFLWTKQCNGEVKLHPNTLNLIKGLVTPSSKSGNEDYILYLAEYINYLVNDEKETSLNFAQKAKIVATLLAFGEQYKYNKEYGYNQMFLGKFIFYQDTDKKYKKEFERNNYYNLPDLKKWYLHAEQEKDMFENDQTLSDDPQPMDYLYRANYRKGPYSK